MTNDEHTSVTKREIELPDEFLDIRQDLSKVVSDHLKKLNEIGVVEHTNPNITQEQMWRVKGNILDLVQQDDPIGYKAMSIYSEIEKVKQTIELIETQSSDAILRYYEEQKLEVKGGLGSNTSKATQRFITHTTIIEAIDRLQDYKEPHPKHSDIRVLVAQTLGINNGEKVVVISESPNTVESLTSFLSHNFEVEQLVDEKDSHDLKNTSSTGRSDVLERFDQGGFEVLITTSNVAEQSKVPEADLTIFYEPTSADILSTNDPISTQLKETEKVVLSTDPPLLPSSYERVENTDTEDTSDTKSAPSESKIKIRVNEDTLDQTVTDYLPKDKTIVTRLDELLYCDYMISDHLPVTHRTVKEFQRTFIKDDKSFFKTIGELDSQYENQVLILEGKNLYDNPRIESQALRSAIGALTVNFDVKVLRTEDKRDTAGMLNALATWELKKRKR